ncbi:high affinity immunoglobulin gamma Fc receptor I-like, partial [Colossoma macropomum]|uniref:high affinity immunoglobulin gamma Fc receptor I-like n=1 Tax=Colossoma macropomum TaxID=42526 RepID=UPI0018650E88
PERPKAVVSVEPNEQAFIGETTTLRCVIHGAGDTEWRYSWNKSDQILYTFNTVHTIRISPVRESDSGNYTCRGKKRSDSQRSKISDAVTLTVSDKPKPTLTVDPESPVFTGESVTLKCEIESYSNWRYQWYKGSSRTALSQSQTYTFTIRSAADQDQYWCRGERDNRPSSSQHSNPVTLTVKERPKAVVSIQPNKQVFRGETVTLRCDIRGKGISNWQYSWFKDDSSTPVSNKQQYRISSVTESHSGIYTCRGTVRGTSRYSHTSDAVTLTVSGESMSLPVFLMVSPSRAQHFITDSLSLSCEGQSDSTGWRVRRYTHSEKVSDCSSGWGSVTKSTGSISSLNTSHTGVYWCESESGESSNPVNITVHNGDVILDSPVHPVTEGDPLTLHCLYRDPKPSNLTAEFYKDGSLLQTQTTGEMTIHTVSKSDEGLYHCKHPEKGESPQSWISVRRSNHVTVILVAVALSLTLFLIVMLCLICCCKKKKGNKKNTSQTSGQSQNTGSTLLQPGQFSSTINQHLVFTQVNPSH